MAVSSVRLALLSLVPLLSLAACPDPTGSSSMPGGTVAGGAPSGPGAGGPGAGGPGAGGAGGPGAESGARPSDAHFQVDAGKGVTLSGTYSYAGDRTGTYRIDFLTMQAGSPPVLAQAMTLDAPGDWSVEVPKDFGDIYVVAFVDAVGDGPSPDDPAARLEDPVKVGGSDISGLSLVLKDNADLGELTPGGESARTPPPPEGAPVPGAGLPPEGGPPPEGVAPEGMAAPTDAKAPDAGGAE